MGCPLHPGQTSQAPTPSRAKTKARLRFRIPLFLGEIAQGLPLRRRFTNLDSPTQLYRKLTEKMPGCAWRRMVLDFPKVFCVFFKTPTMSSDQFFARDSTIRLISYHLSSF